MPFSRDYPLLLQGSQSFSLLDCWLISNPLRLYPFAFKDINVGYSNIFEKINRLV